MFRTLTRTGTASTTLALPASWVKEQQLKPGQQVRVEQLSDSLRITPVHTEEREAITIQYSEALIEEMLTKLYTEHYTSITIESQQKLPGALRSLIRRYPGFTILEQREKQVLIARTLGTAGSNPRAVLRRVLRLIEDGLSSNPPRFDAEIQHLLFLLTLEQYERRIVKDLQEFIAAAPADAPHYENAYAHCAQLFSSIAAQYAGFSLERSESIGGQLRQLQEIEQKGFARTRNAAQLSRLLHATRILGRIHNTTIQQQSIEALQQAKKRNRQKTFTLGVCLADQSNRFWEVDVKQSLANEAEGTDMQLLIDAPVTDSDVQAQRRILEGYLAAKVDALVFVPIDSKANEDLLQKFAKVKIPIIAIDTDIAIPLQHHFVGFDNYAGGKLVAEYLNRHLGKRRHIVVIEGRPNGNSPERVRGFVENLKEGCTTHALRADYVESIAYEQLISYAQQHPVDAVFAASDNMAQGAIKALEQLKKKALVCGFDYTEEGKASLAAGKQFCDVATHPERIGALAMQLADALLHGKEAASRIIYDIELVTR